MSKVFGGIGIHIGKAGLKDKKENMQDAMHNASHTSEDQYKTIYESLPDAVILVLPDYTIIGGNNAAIKLFGFKDESDLCSHVLPDIFPEYQPDGVLSIEKARKTMADTLEKGSNNFEWLHKKATGESFYSDVFLAVITFNGKKTVQVTVQDIMERKRMQDVLNESETKYRLIFDKAPIAVGISTFDDRFIDINPYTSVLTGYSREELLKINSRELYYSLKDRDELFSRLRSDGEVHNYELRVKHRNGSIRWVLMNFMSFNYSGQDYVFSVLLDITERKNAEEQITHEKAKIDMMIDASSEFIFITDINGIIKKVNKSFETQLGYVRGELIGTSAFNLVSRGDLEKTRDALKRLITVGNSVAIEVTSLMKNGDKISIILSASLFKDENGRPQEIFLIGRNISELKKVEDELRQRNSELETFNKVAVGRELRMIELKKRIAELEAALKSK